MKKKYTKSEILRKFNALSWKDQSNVLYDALDVMQQYNGRSKSQCIVMAMGYDNDEGENDTWIKN